MTEIRTRLIPTFGKGYHNPLIVVLFNADMNTDIRVLIKYALFERLFRSVYAWIAEFLVRSYGHIFCTT
jgi:hypothetical protein